MSKFYEAVFTPPTIEAPSALTLTVATRGEVGVDLVQPTTVTHRYTWVELTYVNGDWTDAVVGVLPFGYTSMVFTGVRTGDVWVRARGADAWGNFSAYSGIVTAVAAGAVATTRWVPLMDGLGNVITDSGTGAAIMAEVIA